MQRKYNAPCDTMGINPDYMRERQVAVRRAYRQARFGAMPIADAIATLEGYTEEAFDFWRDYPQTARNADILHWTDTARMVKTLRESGVRERPRMRTGLVQTNDQWAAEHAHPWVIAVRKVDGGFLVFEHRADAEWHDFESV